MVRFARRVLGSCFAPAISHHTIDKDGVMLPSEVTYDVSGLSKLRTLRRFAWRLAFLDTHVVGAFFLRSCSFDTIALVPCI